jgi:hypothetical protein
MINSWERTPKTIGVNKMRISKIKEIYYRITSFVDNAKIVALVLLGSIGFGLWITALPLMILNGWLYTIGWTALITVPEYLILSKLETSQSRSLTIKVSRWQMLKMLLQREKFEPEVLYGKNTYRVETVTSQRAEEATKELVEKHFKKHV